MTDPIGHGRAIAPASPTPPRRAVDAASAMFLAPAGVLIVTGGLVAAVNSAAPFGHGSWLAAYLVLVGGASQALLGVGRSSLASARRSVGDGRRALALWNVGTLAVALGVLIGVPFVVALGSAALFAALADFGAATARGGPRLWRRAYDGLLLALAISVLVGCALAFAR